MSVIKTKKRNIKLLSIGNFVARETILYSKINHKKYVSEELKKLVPPGSNFGYDVIVYIGKSIFFNCKSNEEIKQELLHKNNIEISISEIDNLAKKFIVYLSIVHSESCLKLKKHINESGGYILHIDSTCEGDSPCLMSGIDEISNIILHNIKIPTENHKKIIPFLQKIKQHFGLPLATVSDMSKAILKSIEIVFPNQLILICHFHFLRDIGKDLFNKENDELRKNIRSYKIKNALQNESKKLKIIIDENEFINKFFKPNFISKKKYNIEDNENIITVTLYTLLQWILNANKECNGYGFPFDQPYLIFFQRIKAVYSELQKLLNNNFTSKIINNIFLKIYNKLEEIIMDDTLENTLNKMQEKVLNFNKLRTAMRITIDNNNNKGLNDEGEKTDNKTIKSDVEQFRKNIVENSKYNKDKDYLKMIKQIDKYSHQLFHEPILVSTKNGERYIQPARTNNVLERLFRDIKRNHRKKSGTNSMNKKLKTMLADTPLIKNLQNEEYLKIILNNKTFEERFAEVDIKKVREKLKEKNDNLQKIPTQIMKLLKEKHIPEIFKIIIEKVSKI